MYVDASFANGNNYRSISGRIMQLNNGPISWQSKQQTMTATSTAHAEMIAAYEGCLLLESIQSIYKQLQPDAPVPVILCDNQAAITSAKSGFFTNQNRHFMTKLYYLIDEIKYGRLVIEYVPTDQQLADGLTKALPEGKFSSWLRAIS